MPTIAVTGATGQLGRLVVAALLARGVPAQDVIAAVRTPEKAADLAALGVQVRHADYAQPETLAPALQGADRVLLISGTPGDRVAGLLADGTIKVPIQETYELAQAPEALGALSSGHTQGKIALRVA